MSSRPLLNGGWNDRQKFRRIMMIIILAMIVSLAINIWLFIRWASSSNDSMPPESSIAPMFPYQWTAYHRLTDREDVGRVWYAWYNDHDTAWKTEHSNLFAAGFSATLLWLNRSMYVYTEDNTPIPQQTNNGSCCRYKQFGDIRQFPPWWLQRPRHYYVGNTMVNGMIARTWYSPVMNSIVWDVPVANITLEEGSMSFPPGNYRPIRWDNTPRIDRSGSGAITTLWTDWQADKEIPRSAFDLPLWCNGTLVDPCVFRTPPPAATSSHQLHDSVIPPQLFGLHHQ